MYQTFNGNHTKQQSGPETVLTQILSALQEIKVQNLYLVERNVELEYLVERDLKPRINEGFSELKSDIQSLKK